MKAITVSSPCNGSGKTSLILSILSAFPHTFAFTKFTTIYGDEQFCPAKDQDCACHRLHGDYLICSDEEVLSQPNTDTGRIWRSAAVQTSWCVSRLEGYPAMVGEYLKSWSKPDVPLLMEGNTVARYLKPQLRLFVVNPSLSRSAWKEGSEEFLHEADWVIVNRHPVGTPTDPDTKSISVLLDGVRKKCVEGLPDPLNQWQDLKLYQTIAGFLNESG